MSDPIFGRDLDPGFIVTQRPAPRRSIKFPPAIAALPAIKQGVDLPQLAVAKFFPSEIALRRLVDFDRLTAGEAPIFFAELAGLKPDTAAGLFRMADRAMIADLIVSDTAIGTSKARSIIDFAGRVGSLNGIAGPFASALSILASTGDSGIDVGLSVLRKLPRLSRMGGGDEATGVFDFGQRAVLVMGLEAMNGMLFKEKSDPQAMRDGGGFSERANSAQQQWKSSEGACRRTMQGIGGILGATMGAVAAGALSDGVLAPLGRTVGGALGGVAGGAVADDFCGGVRHLPKETDPNSGGGAAVPGSPTPAQPDTSGPTPATAPAPPSPPSPDVPASPPSPPTPDQPSEPDKGPSGGNDNTADDDDDHGGMPIRDDDRNDPGPDAGKPHKLPQDDENRSGEIDELEDPTDTPENRVLHVLVTQGHPVPDMDLDRGSMSVTDEVIDKTQAFMPGSGAAPAVINPIPDIDLREWIREFQLGQHDAAIR